MQNNCTLRIIYYYPTTSTNSRYHFAQLTVKQFVNVCKYTMHNAWEFLKSHVERSFYPMYIKLLPMIFCKSHIVKSMGT